MKIKNEVDMDIVELMDTDTGEDIRTNFWQKTPDLLTSSSILWKRSNIYSHNNAFTIYKKQELPNAFKSVLENTDQQATIRMNTTLDSKYITMSTKDNIAILENYQLEAALINKSNHFIFPAPKNNLHAPFVNIIYSTKMPAHNIENDNKIDNDSLLITTTDGRLTFRSEIKNTTGITIPSSYAEYQLTLGLNEQVLCVATFDWSRKYQAMIGTSTGNIYLVQLRKDSENNNAISFDGRVIYGNQKNPGLLKSMWSYFSIANHPENESDIGHIIKIVEGHTRDEIIVLNSNYIQRWIYDLNDEPMVSTILHLSPIIEKMTAETLLPEYIRSNVSTHILDVERYRNTKWIILYSYSVPEMGDYSQFALLLIEGKSHSTNQGDYQYEVKDVFSLPYSTMLKTRKQNATLQAASGPIVYVTFDDCVIAVSITANSLFEHPLVLKQEYGNNQVIGTVVKNHIQPNEENEHITSALVFTTSSDVLEFSVNNNHILESSANGNIYAIDYEDNDQRVTDQLRSQLEQAVYFGISKQNPLYFPLRVEGHKKIGNVALSFANHIVTEDESSASTSLNQELLLTRKLMFVTQIIHLINVENLQDLVDEDTYTNLLKIAEACQLGLEVIKYCTKCIMENNDGSVLFMTYLPVTMNDILGISHQQQNHSESFKECLNQLTSYHVLDIPTWLEKIEVYESEHTGTGILKKGYLLSTVSDFIMQTITAIRLIEHTFIYKQGMQLPIDGLSFNFSYVLKRFFNNIKLCLDNLKFQPSSLSSTQLYDALCKQLINIGILLLEIYSEKSKTVDDHGTYRQNIGWVINAFWDLKLEENAISLSKQYKYMPTLVLYTQSLSGETQKNTMNDFIQEYDYDFKYELLCYYITTNCEEKVLTFDLLPEENIIQAVKINPKVAWKYHLKLGQFYKTFDYLEKVLLFSEDIHTRKILYSQAKLAYLTSQSEEISSSPSLILESPIMKSLSANLELIENEENILNKFNDMLTGQGLENLSEKAEFIISKVATNLLEGQFDYELMALSKLIIQLLNKKTLDFQEFITLLCYMDNNGHNIENYLLALYIVNKGNNDISQPKIILSLIWKFVYLKDNWPNIDQYIKNPNDLQISTIYKQTILFRILLLCKSHGVSNDLILRPSEVDLNTNNHLDNLLKQNILHHDLDHHYNEIVNIITNI
ncbi:unnamed protein product [Cunninghamella blakesleeana]